MNRLARERSPYLLQHAANPVDWYPWGDEAFARARAEAKPIFLSIGYSTCHWCHVMEHESFENAATAAVLNEHFVSVKVDREERPDVDRVYMTFVQATTGSGGWPMSVWLTPDLKPFFGGTYFPGESRWGRPAFIDLLREIVRVWRDERDRLLTSADEVTKQLLAHEAETPSDAVPSADALDRTVGLFTQAFDVQYAGFGQAPKFPRPSELLFLLREYARTGRNEPRDMALQTLRAIAIGGMRDHVGGGFHRYSVDRAWRVPHFEKMLYDQAQLVLAYIEGAQASGDPFFIEVAEDTLRYVMREMTDEAGGFYSAEDADSVPHEHAREPDARKTEGAFYLWAHDEIVRLFGGDADVVRAYFGIRPDGNAASDPHEEFLGQNILYVAQGLDAIARDTGRSADEVSAVLQRARLVMFESRLQRPRPHLDDKVLTGWNGLMMAAFARMARLMRGLGEHGTAAAGPYLQTARAAAAFLRQHAWNAELNTLQRRYRNGHAEIEAFAEDYAYLIFGLLELFAVDPDPAWLSWAVALQDRQDELFWDEQGGGWFSTTGTDTHILLRMKESYDGAEPTASSIGAANLLTLTQLVDRPVWSTRLERVFKLFGSQLAQMGRAVPMMAAVLSVYASRPAHVVIVGADGGEMARALAVRYLPHVFALVLSPSQQATVSSVLPLVKGMTPLGGAPTAYVCRNFVCAPAITSVDTLVREVGARADQ
ncbi:MAG: thioredoxin domain-containing protein [Vicinamibacterales bacterium]